MQKQPITLTDEQKIAHLEKQLRKLLNENKNLKEQLALKTKHDIIEQDIEHSTKEKKSGGRPPKVTNDMVLKMHELKSKNYSIRDIAKELKVSVGTVHRFVKASK